MCFCVPPHMILSLWKFPVCPETNGNQKTGNNFYVTKKNAHPRLAERSRPSTSWPLVGNEGPSTFTLVYWGFMNPHSLLFGPASQVFCFFGGFSGPEILVEYSCGHTVQPEVGSVFCWWTGSESDFWPRERWSWLAGCTFGCPWKWS